MTGPTPEPDVKALMGITPDLTVRVPTDGRHAELVITGPPVVALDLSNVRALIAALSYIDRMVLTPAKQERDRLDRAPFPHLGTNHDH